MPSLWELGVWEDGEIGHRLRGWRENRTTNPHRHSVLVFENYKYDTEWTFKGLAIQQEKQMENN